jgi:primosomal protein N' (replication factor Y)
VATPRLFKLKAEVANAPSGPRALVLPFARVRVDTGVFHLDQLYDYVIPERLSDSIDIGIRVQIPFGNRETEGIIVDRVSKPERAGELKSITKILSPHPVASTETLNLIDTVSQRYACNPWDIVRSAIPPRVSAVDKAFSKVVFKEAHASKNSMEYRTFAPFSPAHIQVGALIEKSYAKGSVLVVAPDENDVDLIIARLKEIQIDGLKLTASMPRDERYRNFLNAASSSKAVVVGTRSSVFAPVGNLSTIIVFKEASHDHYEIRSPGWNTRDIATIRAEQQSLMLILTGFSPSIEAALAIDLGSMKYSTERHVVPIKAFTPTDGALLPGRIFTEIRAALKSGPVLFLAPRKGYGNAVLCAHCRNIAACPCGGRLAVSSKGSAPTCVHCGKDFPQWRCLYCQRDKQYLAARGIDRASEEIARAFTGYPVIISAGDVIKRSVENKPSLVLATPGSQPFVEGGYSAIVVLDGTRFFAHTDLRTAERARELFLESSAMIGKNGKVLLVIEEEHPIVSSVARWNIAPLIKRELAERKELNLPPYATSAVLVMEQSSVTQIHTGLKKAAQEGRLPTSTQIFGPTLLSKGQAKIVLHVDRSDSLSLISAVHELQRRRSISNKELFTVRINPYSL